MKLKEETTIDAIAFCEDRIKCRSSEWIKDDGIHYEPTMCSKCGKRLIPPGSRGYINP